MTWLVKGVAWVPGGGEDSFKPPPQENRPSVKLEHSLSWRPFPAGSKAASPKTGTSEMLPRASSPHVLQAGDRRPLARWCRLGLWPSVSPPCQDQIPPDLSGEVSPLGVCRLSPLSPCTPLPPCISHSSLSFQSLSSATLAVGTWTLLHKIVFSGLRSLWTSFEILLRFFFFFFGHFPNDFKHYVMANNMVLPFLLQTPSTPVASFLTKETLLISYIPV